jgi:GNAT superfamily N-acetyltransferase
VTLTIREATDADLAALPALYRHLNPGDPLLPFEEAKARLQCLKLYEGSALLVGAIGERLVTSCTLVVIPNLTRGGAPYGLIENVVTDAARRGKGYATAILHAAAERAWAHDCYKIMLLTGSKEPATLRFYEKAGFEQSKTGFQMRRAGAKEEIPCAAVFENIRRPRANWGLMRPTST